MSKLPDIPIYSYFYPVSTQCPERQERARAHGYELADETQLCQDAQPLYEGHQQPVTYCLGDVAVRNWDDADPEAMASQIDLATQNGVNGFIFDSYLGQKDGKSVHEMASVVNRGFLGAENADTIKFALMVALGSPRVALPISPGMAFEENRRDYDRSRGTVETIVDTCANLYWDKDNYIRMGQEDRPYLSIYASEIRKKDGARDEGELSLPDMVAYMREYSQRRYKIEPYIVGVLKTARARASFESGADAMTGYAFLPNFEFDADSLQDYNALLEQRMAEWHEIADGSTKPYVPPVVLGWDGSPRGINGLALEEVAGVYPFTPIVTGSSPATFEHMLREQRDFILQRVPPEHRYTLITAWNEITEGTALLPKVRADGSLDTTYLDALRRFSTGPILPGQRQGDRWYNENDAIADSPGNRSAA